LDIEERISNHRQQLVVTNKLLNQHRVHALLVHDGILGLAALDVEYRRELANNGLQSRSNTDPENS